MDQLPPEVMANVFNHLALRDRSSLAQTNKRNLVARVFADPILDTWDYFRVKEYAAQSGAHRDKVTRFLDDLYNRATARWQLPVEKHELIERIYYLNGYRHANLNTITVTVSPGYLEGSTVTEMRASAPAGSNWDECKVHEYSDGVRYSLSWMTGQRYFRIDGPAYVEIIGGVERKVLYADAYQHVETHYDEAGSIVATFIDGEYVGDAFFSGPDDHIRYIPW